MNSNCHVGCSDVRAGILEGFRRLVMSLALLVACAAIGPLPGHSAAFTFRNTNNIDIIDGALARPYPVTNRVTGVTGLVVEVSVTLSNFSHRFPDDVDVLLVGPGGQKAMVMSDAGGTIAVTNVTLTFADRYSALLPDSARINSGFFHPTDYSAVGGDTFLTPAPAGPYGTQLSVFNGINPNGTWNLFIVDDTGGPGGIDRITRGWSLTFQTANPPTIVTQPQDRSAAPGSNATFKVEAGGTGPFGYSWLRNGVTIVPFSTGTSLLTLSNITPAHAGEYTVRVTNAAGSVVSQPATLYVLGPLSIVDEPADDTLDPGTPNYTMRVTAAGTPPLYYQWFLNGVVLPNATNVTLVISNFQARNAGSYSVVVVTPDRELGDCVQTRPSNLRLKTGFLPMAQNQRSTAGLLSGAAGIVAGTNFVADKESGEPNHAGRPGGRSVWYQWVSPQTGLATFHTQGSSFDTLLAIYTASPTTGALSPVAADEDNGGYYTSLVRFNAMAAQPYFVAVDAFGGRGGHFLLSWLVVTNVSFPRITAAPVAQTVTRGGTARFEVIPTSPTPPLNYQWLRDGNPISGAVGSVFTDVDVQDSDLGYYSVRIGAGTGPFFETQPVALEIGPNASIQFARKRGNLGDFVPLTSGSGFSPAAVAPGPVAGTIVVPVGTDRSHAFRTNEPPSNVPQVCQFCSQGRYFYWMKAVDEGLLELNTGASDLPVIVGVYEFTNTLDRVSLVACSDEFGLTRFQPRRNVTNIIALEVRKDLNAPPMGEGIIRLAWKLTPPCRTLTPGDNLTLTTAPPQTGPGPHRYQWHRDGQPIVGATSATLALINVRVEDAGTYTVLLGNVAGEELKTIAEVNVEGDLKLNAELFPDPASIDPEEPIYLLRIRARWTKPFVLEMKSILERGAWQPVLTNSDVCRTLIFTSPVAEPQSFYRGVEWSP